MPKETVYKPVEKPNKIYTGGTLTPPKFMPDYYEWLSVHGVQVIKDTVIADTKSTIYTVPNNYVLFISSAFLHAKTSAAGAGADAYLMINNQKILMLTGSNTDQATDVISNSFFPPLIISSKDKFELFSGAANFFVWGGFTGFLIAIKDLPVF